MEQVFLRLFNLSISAGWLILAVLAVRLIFRRAPKWIFGILWALVALRLLVPFTLESSFSLQPSAEVVPQKIVTMDKPEVQTGIAPMNNAVNPVIGAQLSPQQAGDTSVAAVPEKSVGLPPYTAAVEPVIGEEKTEKAASTETPMGKLVRTLTFVWLGGTVLMLGYALISYLRLRHKVRESILLRDNIRLSDQIPSPFLLGIFRPRIFLPVTLEQDTADYVLAHEQAHLKRRDHLWKPLGFVLLSVYWFQPLLWLAYILLCRDIELACDEKVIKTLGAECKRSYSEALIGVSVSRRRITACPLAFGEVGVKERVKNVLNYRKPAFWVIVASLVACVAVGVLFLTSPKKDVPKQPLEDGIEESTEESIVDGLETPTATCWFENADEWNKESSITVDAFPDTVFYYDGAIYAEQNGRDYYLYGGMPIWNAYFCDLNGDSKPEVISTVSFGSGMVDNHIEIYDFANKMPYQIWDRGNIDYQVVLENGTLYLEESLYGHGEYSRLGVLTLENAAIPPISTTVNSTIVTSTGKNLFYINLPRIHLPGEGIAPLNEELYQTFYTQVLEERKNTVTDYTLRHGPFADTSNSIGYSYAISDDILSLCITETFNDANDVTYHVYNIRMSDGHILTDEEFLEEMGIDKEQFYRDAAVALGMEYARFITEALDENPELVTAEWNLQCLKDTIAMENAKTARPCLEWVDGAIAAVCFIGDVYQPAGASYHEACIPLDGGEKSPYYEQLLAALK